MIYSFPPPPPFPNDEEPSSAGHRPPDVAIADDRPSNWLRSRRRGRSPSLIPLHVEDAYLVSDGTEEPDGGLVRFRISGAGGGRLPRRAWWRRADMARQLAGSDGQLRLVRDDTAMRTSRALIAMLTLNGVTDAASLVGLNIFGSLPSYAESAPGRVAAVAVDVRFSAGVWRLSLPPYTRCQVHLEGVMRLLSDWPLP